MKVLFCVCNLSRSLFLETKLLYVRIFSKSKPGIQVKHSSETFEFNLFVESFIFFYNTKTTETSKVSFYFALSCFVVVSTLYVKRSKRF